MIRALVICTVSGGILAAATLPAAAQGYPSRPIRMVVPFPGGGATDATARMFGQLMSAGLGQNIVVDNRAGATGSIGAREVMRASPDGHTVLYTSSSFALAPLLYKKVPYDPIADFEHVQSTVIQPMVLVVNPQFQAKSIADFISHAKANPGAINYGSSGSGGINHLSMSEFGGKFGLKMSHVPYKGGAPAMVDLIAGQIQALFAPTGELLAYLQGKRMRALGIAWSSRSTLLPDVPTLTEALQQEYPGVGVWHGVMVPKGTPKDIVTRLHAELNKAVQNPDVRAKLVAQGNVMLGGAPDQFTALLRAESARWGKVVKDLDLKPLD